MYAISGSQRSSTCAVDSCNQDVTIQSGNHIHYASPVTPNPERINRSIRFLPA